MESQELIPPEISFELEPNSFFSSWIKNVDVIFDKRSKNNLNILGQVFTPISIVDRIIHTTFHEWDINNWKLDQANPYSLKSVNLYYHEWLQANKIPHILDFGVGSGHFILRILWGLLQECEKLLSNYRSNTFEWVKKIIDECNLSLYAIDIDFLACWATIISEYVLIIYFLIRWEHYGNIKFSDLMEKNLVNLLPGKVFYQNFLQEKGKIARINDPLTIIIGNPPYVFSRDLPLNMKGHLKTESFITVEGQYDLTDVFIEQAIEILQPGGVLGIIVSESLLSLENHAPLRRYLAQFGDIIRVQKIQNTFLDQTVENILLFVRKGNSSQITLIIEPTKPIIIDRIAGINRITTNLIPTDEMSDQILSFIRSKYLSINQWNEMHPKTPIECFRGVEISKKGQIMQCPHCQLWMPWSQYRVICSHCHRELKIDRKMLPTTTLLFDKDEFIEGSINLNAKSMKFITTIALNSNSIATDKYIRTDYTGINYKSLNQYLRQRIVVRQILNKHRICAALAQPRTMTSQSVYNLLLPSQWDPILKELLGYVQSDLISYFNYYSFSKGKRLFSRILLGKLKELPWIPKQLHETFPSLPQDIPPPISIPPEFRLFISNLLDE